MDINQLVQYGTLAAAAVALWQAWQERKKSERERQQERKKSERERQQDRDAQTKWRTEADIKLDSIDVNWKPQVNARLGSLEDRALNQDKQLVEQNKTMLNEIRDVKKGLSGLDQEVKKGLAELDKNRSASYSSQGEPR